MSSPKIKLYLLPPGYSSTSDDDVREAVNDELLPCYVKQEALNTVMAMTGIMPAFSANCIKIDISGGLVTDTVDPTTGHLGVTNPSGIALPSGAYSPVLLDNSMNPIPASGWKLIKTNTGAFDHIEFLGTPPSAPTLRFFKISASGVVNTWALPADNPYTGPNDSLSRVVIVGTGCSDPTKEGVPLLGNTYLSGTNNGLISLPFTCSSLEVTYWWKTTFSNYYAADNDNWVADHMRMNPDIFVGSEDYPGDSGTINGTPVIQGVVPEYVQIGTYQLDYRSGYVRFPAAFDSTQTPVTANFSYLIGVRNVTGQVLDQTERQLHEWSAPSSFEVDIPASGGHQYAVSVYMVDSPSVGRQQAVDLMSMSYSVLATHTVSSFASGVWATFTGTGPLKLRFRSTNANAATVSAICFDPSPSGTAAFVSTNALTEGNWKGTYGSDGYVIPGDNTKNPWYVSPSPSGQTLDSLSTYFGSSDPIMLEVANSYVYKAATEPVYTGSHGNRWVNRNTIWMPQNVYVNGVLAGTPSSVNGEFLTVKTS